MSYAASTVSSNVRRPLWQELIAVVAYPASFILAVAAFLWFSENGYPRWISAYLPVVVCAVVVLPLLERVMPYRRDWRPASKEWLTDAFYTIVIQIGMPPLLALLVVLGLNDLTRPYLHSSLWPHEWPIWAQGVLMVLLVDLMRYWLHRFAHTNHILWRLHAVHHSPNKCWRAVKTDHPCALNSDQAFVQRGGPRCCG
jgi:sterol desaturase/sphingolipid hydroxylase (fatty acid hydroxylase superfamily)